jgi:hypothetical protein
MRMKNTFEIRGDVTAIIIESPKHGRRESLISTCKLELVSAFPNSWYVHWSRTKKDFYVKGQLPRVNGKRNTAFLHRWITNAPSSLKVDHINHETLDNSDENLRVVTQAENNQNVRGARKNSKSGIQGVIWIGKRAKWVAQIKSNGKHKHIGYYNEKDEAEQAVKKARATLFPFSKDAREVS